jgi:fatty acid desaturase
VECYLHAEGAAIAPRKETDVLLEQETPEVRQSHGGGQVRGLAGDARDIIQLSRGLVAYNFAYLALVWAVAIGAIVLFWAHPAWYTFVLAFLVVSSRQQALLNVEHECIHGKLTRGRRLNTFVGRFLCASPVGSPYEASRARHLSHHRLLATPDDPDHDLHAGPGKQTRAGMFKHFAGGLVGGYAGMVLMGPPRADGMPKAPGSARRDVLSLAVTQAVVAAGLTLAFDWWVYPALWLAPLVTVTVLGHLIRSFAEHAITDDEAPEHSNRLITIHSNWLERFLVAPYSMNYHAEHHLLPSVPAPRLKRLHQRLGGRADLPPVLIRSSYGQALRRYVRALPDD